MSSTSQRAGLALIAASSLSQDNPEATREQRDCEALAMRVYATPQVQKTRHETAVAWLDKPVSVSAEALSTFDAGVSDFAFHCCLDAVNGDPNHPKVLRVECEPHQWFGMSVPGSRRGGNNADNAYRIIPVDGKARFEITGRRFDNPPPDVTFTLIGNSSMSKTLGSLEFRDMEIGPDDVFTVSVDPEPANGRRNHLQSSPEVRYVFVRDSMTDWATQRVNALAVRRLDPPTAPEAAFDELVARAVQHIKDDTPYYSTTIDITAKPAVNVFAMPFNPGQYGGLISQRGSFTRFCLADDEAIVVTVTTAGAAYLSLHAHDPWWVTLPHHQHTASLNNAQAVANPDGTYTFVIAPRDPGVYNWIDTTGLHEGILYFRWQALPKDTPYDGGPGIVQQRVVKLAQLASALPAGTRRVTADERRQQRLERAAAAARRWVDR